MFLDKRLIIFDLDGTLIDSLGVWSQVDQELLRELSAGRVIVSEDEACRLRVEALGRYGEGTDAYFKYMADLKAKYDLPGTPEEIHTRRYELAKIFLRDRVDYREGAPEVIRALHAAGVKLAIATTTRRRNIDVYGATNRHLMEKAPLFDYFEMIVTRNDVEHVKPDPEALQKILAHFEVKPEECLMIEDARPGIEAARSIGMDAVILTERHNEEPRDVLDALVKARFENHTELLAAIRAEAAAVAAKA